MAGFRLCLEYSGNSTEFHDDASYQAAYRGTYKPLGALLFSHPELKFSFYFTGPQLEFFKKKNPEFLDLIKTLVARKQVEIIGGGYYNPIFPLIFPADRAAQIEKLSLVLRQNFGKRPRGVSLFCSAWEPSLVSTFDACNIEYVILDGSQLPPAKQLFLPVVMNNLGKSTVILPYYDELVFNKDESAEKYCGRLLNAFDSVRNAAGENPDKSDNSARMTIVPLDKDSVQNFLDENWLAAFLDSLGKNSSLSLELPGNCIRDAEVFVPCFVHAGINSKTARWCFMPYEPVELTDSYPVNIYDYLQTYKASQSLFDRMMDVSLLVNQCHGDKMRKNAARERLLAAQSGYAFVCFSHNELAAFNERQSAYKNLTEAEKLVRECSPFKESVTSYDYNGDGFKEYICRLEKSNVCIGPYGGSIFELDIMKASGNYADNISRIKKYDGLDDNYYRGIFVDHLFEEEEAVKYCEGEPCRNGLFSARRYREVSFSSKRQEIHFEASTNFSTLDQPILLKKNYVVKSDGIQVQYILINQGPVAVRAKFAVESNFAELNLLNPGYTPYNIEIVSGDNVIFGSSEKACTTLIKDGLLQNASALQVTDRNSNVNFIFTPNENAAVTFFPVTFKRRNMESDIVQNESRTFVTALIWDVDLAAGMEVEKTINLSITYRKHKKN